MPRAKLINLFYLFFLTILLAIILSPVDLQQWITVLYDVEKIFLGSIVALLLLFLLVMKFLVLKIEFKFRTIDLAIVAYALYIIVYSAIIRQVILDTVFILDKILLLALYIFFRNANRNWMLPLFGLIILASFFSNILWNINPNRLFCTWLWAF